MGTATTKIVTIVTVLNTTYDDTRAKFNNANMTLRKRKKKARRLGSHAASLKGYVILDHLI